MSRRGERFSRRAHEIRERERRLRRHEPPAIAEPCAHPRPGEYVVTAGDADWIIRRCRVCLEELAPAEPRCRELLNAGDRRCMAPARVGSLCRQHRWQRLEGPRAAALNPGGAGR